MDALIEMGTHSLNFKFLKTDFRPFEFKANSMTSSEWAQMAEIS